MNSLTRSLLIHFLIYLLLICEKTTAEVPQELINGYISKPDPSQAPFQPLLNDPTRNFSFGFFHVNPTRISLAVVHLPSSQPLWLADPTGWSDSKRVHLSFNDSLVLYDHESKVLWSTISRGDAVLLLNNSNLQIQKLGDDKPDKKKSRTVTWQSFDFPQNTLVENQNFTSAMKLVSSNGLYSMSLGDNFMGLYAKFSDKSGQIYYRHTALQAKASVVKGNGPIHARVNSDGYLGMYQTGDTPVDVEAFNSYQLPVTGMLIVRLEPDGNLKGYYWDGSNWILNYQAIPETCELPSPCGSYGLCNSGSGCSCLDNKTEFRSAGECNKPGFGDFCEMANFRVFRRTGVELPFKELMEYETTSSAGECEGLCDRNCSCWGAVHNNASGFCYLVDYPIQTLVAVSDDSKSGYFKIRVSLESKKLQTGSAVGLVFLGGLAVFVVCVIGIGSFRIWRRQRGVKMEADGVAVTGPYKNLGSDSFRSIEMCNK